ncbi:MAG: ABC transporter substrate-binding protein [Planctomycetota bacterium]
MYGKSLLVLAVIGLAFAGCTAEVEPKKTPGQTPDAPAELPKLTIGHVGHDHQIALYVAALQPKLLKERGGVWLKEKKPREVYDLMDGDEAVAELHLTKVGGGSNMPAAMERGEIDVGLGGIPAVVFFVDKGAPFRVLSPLNVDGDMLLLRPDIPVDDWAGFVQYVKESKKPVKIGYKAPVAVAKLVFMGALDHEGIPHSEAAPPEGGVELVHLKGAKNTVPLLESGAVDGVVINEPFGSIAESKNVGKIVSLLGDLPPDGRWKNHPCCCVCATQATIDGHREVLKKLLAMMYNTTKFIQESPEAAGMLAAEWTKKPMAVELESVPNIVYLMEPGEAYRKGLETWFGIMNEVGKFKGAIKGRSFEEAFELCHDLTLINEVIEGR